MRNTLLSIALLASLSALAEEAPWLAEARTVASSVPPKLLQVLNEEIAKDGPAAAIAVCRDKAPQLAKAAAAQSGWAIRRVSLRNRNPKAVPDAWEHATLEEFDRRAAAGEAPASLEKSALVTEAGRTEYRFMKALAVQPVCLTCHGAADKLTPEVAAQLHTLYRAHSQAA